MRYIKVVGTHNTNNKLFHLVAFEAFYEPNIPKLIDGLISPRYNVATVEQGATVLEGVSRTRNALLNGDFKNYDWDSGYTCHQLGSGSIVIQLGQPYHISLMRMLLWDCDTRTYSFYIETSTNQSDWTIAVDKREEQLRSWQQFTFESRPVVFIRIIGMHNTANEVCVCIKREKQLIFTSNRFESLNFLAFSLQIFHCVHFECQSQDSTTMPPTIKVEPPKEPTTPTADDKSS